MNLCLRSESTLTDWLQDICAMSKSTFYLEHEGTLDLVWKTFESKENKRLHRRRGCVRLLSLSWVGELYRFPRYKHSHCTCSEITNFPRIACKDLALTTWPECGSFLRPVVPSFFLEELRLVCAWSDFGHCVVLECYTTRPFQNSSTTS